MTRLLALAGLTLMIGAPCGAASPGKDVAVTPPPVTTAATRGAASTAGIIGVPCPEDLSGNGTVDFADILIVIGAWGPCGVPCPEDLSGNGIVDFADILIVIGAWGPCPLAKCCIGFTEADLLAFWEDPIANPLPDTCVEMSCADCAAAGGMCYEIGDCPLVVQSVERMVDDAMGQRHETCSALNCPPAHVPGCGCGSLIDALFTGAIPCNGNQQGSFDDFSMHPLPPGFFGPGSDPFTEPVCFEGVPLGNTPFGVFDLADTLILRSEDPFECTEPLGQTLVDIEIVELSLQSIEPLVVTFNGGQNPQLWHLEVGLSDVPQQPGFMDVIKDHPNGGAFQAVLPVLPRLTFTQVGNPGNIQIVDFGQQGIPPINFNTQPTPWVHEVQLGTVKPEGGTSCFNPGIGQ